MWQNFLVLLTAHETFFNLLTAIKTVSASVVAVTVDGRYLKQTRKNLPIPVAGSVP